MVNPRASWMMACVMLALPGYAVAQAASSAAAMVVDIPGDAFYHKPTCPLVREAGSKVKVMRQGEAERRGLKAHACPVLADGSADPNAVPVYVQEGDDRYHKEGCEKLGEAATKTQLAEGAKGRWPCTTCRPPIRKRSGVGAGTEPDRSGDGAGPERGRGPG